MIRIGSTDPAAQARLDRLEAASADLHATLGAYLARHGAEVPR